MIAFSGWAMKPPSSFARLIFFVLVSASLMLLDHRGQHLERMRVGLNVLVYPVQILAALPVQAGNAFFDFFGGKTTLKENYTTLYTEHLLLLAKLQKYETIEAENKHLRELLGAAARVSERATIAELLEVGSQPFTRKIVIGKGIGAGVYKGQPIIDAHGVIGRITDVGGSTSKGTLITDSSHSLPVQVVRNGLRAIAVGTGANDHIELPYLTGSADIQEGDLLVTSGIGGFFPPDYPVARVVSITHDPNESFLKIIAVPLARLDHNREVMLIWPAQTAADDQLAGPP